MNNLEHEKSEYIRDKFHAVSAETETAANGTGRVQRPDRPAVYFVNSAMFFFTLGS